MSEARPPFRPLAIVPNTLSIARLIAAAALPIVPMDWRLWLIIGAAASDCIDGFIARRFGVASSAGGLLDAVADKAFTLTALAMFTWSGQIGFWETVGLLNRDLVVAMVAGQAAMLRRWDAFQHMPSRLLGKITTAALFTLFISLAIEPDRGTTGTVLLYLAMALSIAAAFDYFDQFERSMRHEMKKMKQDNAAAKANKP